VYSPFIPVSLKGLKLLHSVKNNGKEKEKPGNQAKRAIGEEQKTLPRRKEAFL